MPTLPAAAPAPLAVLVLAWDEATPAVRALVEAAPAPAPAARGSILVLVPQASAPGELSTADSLPPPPAANPAPTPPSAALPLAASAAPAAPPAQTPVAATTEPLASSPAKVPPTPLAPAGSAVHVLRLSSLGLAELSQRAGQPLPAPVWLGAARAPAAPYQGATSTAGGGAAAASVLPAILTEAKPLAGAALRRPTPPEAPLPPAAPPYVPAGFESQGADLEADLLPLDAPELPYAEQARADLPALPTSEAASFSAAQAGWPEALAALRRPVPAPALPTPPPAGHPAAAGLPARPANPRYEAPNLNYQVIQYARFALPVALAAGPYAVIYAPAWPTWLAAQELRQRTGGPLVLHVTTLAAGPDEPLGTATGWMADLQRQALRRADVILAETPALTQRLRQELNLPAAAVRTVPAADAAAIAQALHAARPRPAAEPA